MSEKEFMSLLFEMINQDSHINKTKIIQILQRSSLTFDKTCEFTGKKWDHYKEYIYLIMEPNDLKDVDVYKDYITGIIEQIYPVDTGYKYELFGVIFKPGYVKESELTNQKIHFDGIQSQIIDEIREAKYMIWVAMAWFTNRELFDELLKKKKQGVNIQVVIDDNDINRSSSFNLQSEFETYMVNIQSNYKNIMHNKFCVIDLSIVIHGTFNWTNAANYNRETISVDKNSATAKRFADEFIKLKTGIYS